MLLFLVGVTATVPAFACPLNFSDAQMLGRSNHYRVAIRPSAAPIEVGKPFSVDLEVCDADGKPFTGTLKPDAHMPAHKHGMNYRPSVVGKGSGKFWADGFLFHMPGNWQFVIELRADGKSDRVLIDHPVR